MEPRLRPYILLWWMIGRAVVGIYLGNHCGVGPQLQQQWRLSADDEWRPGVRLLEGVGYQSSEWWRV